jgi:hypothetical protein
MELQWPSEVIRDGFLEQSGALVQIHRVPAEARDAGGQHRLSLPAHHSGIQRIKYRQGTQ